MSETFFRPPTPVDGTPIWHLVQATGVLDLNSAYCYVLLCQDFAATSVVTEIGGELAGFITAYVPPGRTDTLFVWQVGTHPDHQGKGLASAMLDHLLERPALQSLQHLETTVSPGNAASRRLFSALARRRGSTAIELPGFAADLFPEGHDPEPLLRIGLRPGQASHNEE